MKELTPYQRDVLETIAALNDHPSHRMPWVIPMDLGGYNGSHHSNTLAGLVRKGLVRCKQRGLADPPEGENGKKLFAVRGSKCYQITPAGRARLAELSTATGRRIVERMEEVLADG